MKLTAPQCVVFGIPARRILADDTMDVVFLDELTYMISYDYLERAENPSLLLTLVPRGKALSSLDEAATESFWK